MDRRAGNALVALGIVVAAAFLSAGAALGADYVGPPWVGVDSASFSIEALIRGDIHGFFAAQPMMGSVSLLVRAPFAALAPDHHDNLLLEYRLGLFPCVLSLGVLGFVVYRMMERNGRPWTARLLTVALVMAGPPMLKALFWGHPEELLATALSVGAILAARRRVVLAAILLGLAIATKQWALLALGPVLAAATGQRIKLLAVAAGTAAAFTLPMALGDLHRFMQQTQLAGHAGPGVTPSSVWWAFGHVSGVQHVDGEAIRSYTVPSWMLSVAEPLVTGLALALSLAYWRRRADRAAADALGLFALLMLVRCVLDPMAISYHNAPFFAALATYESLRRRGLPYLTLAAGAGLLLTAQLGHDPDVLNAAYLAWSLPLALFLGMTLLGSRGLAARLRPRPVAANV